MRTMKKFSTSLFNFLVFGFLLVSCNGQAQPTFRAVETIQTAQTPESINTVQPSLTLTATATPIPIYNVINEKNVSELKTLHQWEVEHIASGSTSFWLSDSEQFIIP